jgi:hypothetical protein
MPYLSKDAKRDHNKNYYLTKVKKSHEVQPEKTLDAQEKPYEYMPYVPPIGFYITIADGSRKWIPRRELMAR